MAQTADKIVFPSGEGFPFSNAIRAGDFVYVSGQIAFLPDGTISTGSIEAQTKIVLDTLQKILAGLKRETLPLDAVREEWLARLKNWLGVTP